MPQTQNAHAYPSDPWSGYPLTLPSAPRRRSIGVMELIKIIAAILKLAIAIVVVAAIIGVVAAVSKDHEKRAADRARVTGTTTTASSGSDAWDPKNMPTDVSSDDLEDTYKANELRGDELYKDKLVRVTGAIKSIERGYGDDPIVILWTREEYYDVRAHFQNRAGLSSLARGQHITIRCLGDGYQIHEPQLRDCVLE